MGKSRRRLILGATALSSVAFLLALGAVAQIADDPRNTSDEYFDAVNDAQCYEHHLEDGFIPFGYRFTPAYSQLPVGEVVPVEVQIRHVTQYTVHEVWDMTVTVNTEEAPAVDIITPDLPEDIEDRWEDTLQHNDEISSGEIYIGAGASGGRFEARVVETDPPLHTIGVPGTLELNADGRTEEGAGEVAMDLDRDFFQSRGLGNYTFATAWRSPESQAPISATVEMNLTVTFTPEAKEVTFASEDLVLRDVPPPGERTVVVIPLRISEQTDEPQLLDFDIRATARWEHQAEDDAPLDDGIYHRFLTMQVIGGDELIEARQLEAPSPVGATINLYNMLTRLLGFIGLFLIVAAMFTGGVFGKKSRRWMNRFTGGAKKRVLWHSSMGFLIVLVATVHFSLALIETRHDISRGLFWGGLAWGLLISLGFTGYYQVRMIKKWNYRVWRHVHLWSAVAVVLFVLVHLIVEGTDLSAVRDLIPGTDRLLWPRGS